MIKLFEDYDPIVNDLSKITEPYISATDMNKSSDILKELEFEEWDDFFLSKDNHQDNIYYHVNTDNRKPYSGVGNGLYLGRDTNVLLKFYDLEEYGFSVSKYSGTPKWFNLMKKESFNKFREIFKDNGIDIINSDAVGPIIMKLGYDGIRYYDIMATGEEFVLFDESKLKLIDTI